MKAAIVKRRRRLVCVACPACGGRHWLPDDNPAGECPRRPAAFTITDLRTTEKR